MGVLEHRVALITGGARGQGAAEGRLFADEGATVYVTDVLVEEGKQTAAAIGGTFLEHDVTEPEQWRAVVDRILEDHGHVDVLVNNAGGGINKAPEEWTVAEWHQVIDLNLASVWFMSRLVAAPMLEQGRGAIVNISSGASFLALPTHAPYGAAKAGMNSLTRSLAAAWTPGGVRVNAVACGAVKTEGYNRSTTRTQLPDDAVIGPGNAIGRVGQPEEIAYPVLFFASDASSYCSGQTLWVNGGQKAPPTS
jgi:NAD(P)-dependent dehydrogenase (short-subunit alcohol dehydrogenase family)